MISRRRSADSPPESGGESAPPRAYTRLTSHESRGNPTRCASCPSGSASNSPFSLLPSSWNLRGLTVFLLHSMPYPTDRMYWRPISASDLSKCLDIQPACLGDEIVGRNEALRV